jgi:soluble lytic murein transglycosylase-like protein
MAYVRKVAQRIGLNEALALAVVDEESHFNPQARNPESGAAGLMQLMPSTIATLKVRDPFDPEESARAGLSLLNAYMHRFGDEREALAAYHSGRGALQSRGISTSDEIYIREVFAKKAVYERILHEALIYEGP